MKNKLRKFMGIILAVTISCGLLPVANADETVTVKINDIKENVLNITSSAQKKASLILASYKNGEIVNVLCKKNVTLEKETKDYTLEGFSYGACDTVKGFVWENIDNAMVPLCESRTESVLSVSGSVTVENGLPETGVQIQAGDTVKADVPKDVALADNTTQLTLSVETKESTESNITAGDDEDLLSLDVHIEGISKDNTVPITVDLGPALATGLNSTSIKLYHVENGETVPMEYVANDKDFTKHNQFKYDPETGNLTLYLATFSEILTVTNTVNAWEGVVNTSWYKADATNYTISKADQLAGFAQIVGGMAEGIAERDSFSGKTVTLTADINLGDAEAKNDENKIFYPIGYYNSTESFNKVSGGDVTSTVYSFEGTFDGAGHTISNFYQNTWEMFGDYNDGYSGTPNHYKDAMGLFGKLRGATVENLTVDNFSSDGEFTTTGVIAAYADSTTDKSVIFKNIAIKNCNPRVYNIGNGGIVGCGGWYSRNDTNVKPIIFENITVDNSNKISSLWGSWDTGCGGIMGRYYPQSKCGVEFKNCHVGAQIDVYNDVCGNYQYYWYRYAGMVIGTIEESTVVDGYTVPDTTTVKAENCTVHFGDWNDYYYCELVANSQASYTHDHQFSRLAQINSLDEIKSGETWTKKGNFLLIEGDTKTCYHIVEDANGTFVEHKHEDAGTEVVDGETVLKEDKQIVYLPFNQLFQGNGWGVKHIPVYNGEDYAFKGITILDREVADSIEKFGLVMTENECIYNDKEYTVGEIFNGKENSNENEKINDASVVVSITAVDSDKVAGVYTANAADWSNGTIKFNEDFEGKVKLTIQDYQFCTPTTITLNIVNSTILDAALNATENDSSKVGRVIFDKFLDNCIVE